MRAYLLAAVAVVLFAVNAAKDENGLPERIARDEQKCGEGVTWTLEDGTLTIKGTGPMYNFSSTEVPWYNERSSVTSIVIEKGVTSIGDFAFYFCDSATSVDIPEGVTYIGKFGFGYCKKINNFVLPVSVTTLAERSFASNTFKVNLLCKVLLLRAMTLYITIVKQVVLVMKEWYFTVIEAPSTIPKQLVLL